MMEPTIEVPSSFPSTGCSSFAPSLSSEPRHSKEHECPISSGANSIHDGFQPITAPAKPSLLSRIWPGGETPSPPETDEKHRSSGDLERNDDDNTANNILNRITTASSVPVEPPPDGGWVAWIQVLMCWLTIMNTWGFVNAFGAFQTHYTTTLLSSYPASTVSWIGSVQAFGVFFFGIFSGRAFDMGHFRITFISGTILAVAGLFLLSWSTELWQIFLTHGLMNGAGGGLLFTPALSLLSTYFDKNRGLAMGIATTGNAIGGLMYPLLVRQLLGVIGYGWTIRVLGFINLFCLGMGCIFFKPRPLRPLGKIPLVDMNAFRDKPFMLYSAGICVISAAAYFVLYYVGSFGHDKLGMTAEDSFNIIMLVNGIGVPARIIPGYLADKYFGPVNTYMPCVLACTIVTFGWLGVSSVGGLYGWTAVFGLSIASYQSLYGAIVSALTPRPEEIGTRLGLVSALSAFTSTVGAPIGGAIISRAGYKPAIAWAGSFYFIGFAFVVAARVSKWGTSSIKC